MKPTVSAIWEWISRTEQRNIVQSGFTWQNKWKFLSLPEYCATWIIREKINKKDKREAVILSATCTTKNIKETEPSVCNGRRQILHRICRKIQNIPTALTSLQNKNLSLCSYCIKFPALYNMSPTAVCRPWKSLWFLILKIPQIYRNYQMCVCENPNTAMFSFSP